MIINLGSKKLQENDNYHCQLTRIQIFFTVSIVDIPKNNLSNADSLHGPD